MASVSHLCFGYWHPASLVQVQSRDDILHQLPTYLSSIIHNAWDGTIYGCLITIQSLAALTSKCSLRPAGNPSATWQKAIEYVCHESDHLGNFADCVIC